MEGKAEWTREEEGWRGRGKGVLRGSIYEREGDGEDMIGKEEK